MLGFTVEEIGEGTCRVRMPQKDGFLRPGGTAREHTKRSIGARDLSDGKKIPYT